MFAAVVSARLIPYYKASVRSKAKFHVSVLHDTVLARITVFGDYSEGTQVTSSEEFDWSRNYRYDEELYSPSRPPDHGMPRQQFVLLELERPVTCVPGSLLIASRLDTDVHTSTCRLAFHGRVLMPATEQGYAQSLLPRLRVYKLKSRQGVVERRADPHAVICRGMFKKESKIEGFTGLRVSLSSGEVGTIEGSFGQSGKFKVRLPGQHTSFLNLFSL